MRTQKDTDTVPARQIRASYNQHTMRVYQAYNNAIANAALDAGTLVSPPFKMERMTWVKPSFLWMMYRSGWGKKDSGQNRILAFDISREGFEWALQNSLLSHQSHRTEDKAQWLRMKKETPVRIQWDPERDLHLTPLNHRSIQIGLTGKAVPLYVNEWIQNVTEVTALATEIHALVQANDLDSATALLPVEQEYQLPDVLAETLQMDIKPSAEPT